MEQDDSQLQPTNLKIPNGNFTAEDGGLWETLLLVSMNVADCPSEFLLPCGVMANEDGAMHIPCNLPARSAQFWKTIKDFALADKCCVVACQIVVVPRTSKNRNLSLRGTHEPGTSAITDGAAPQQPASRRLSTNTTDQEESTERSDTPKWILIDESRHVFRLHGDSFKLCDREDGFLRTGVITGDIVLALEIGESTRIGLPVDPIEIATRTESPYVVNNTRRNKGRRGNAPPRVVDIYLGTTLSNLVLSYTKLHATPLFGPGNDPVEKIPENLFEQFGKPKELKQETDVINATEPCESRSEQQRTNIRKLSDWFDAVVDYQTGILISSVPEQHKLLLTGLELFAPPCLQQVYPDPDPKSRWPKDISRCILTPGQQTARIDRNCSYLKKCLRWTVNNPKNAENNSGANESSKYRMQVLSFKEGGPTRVGTTPNTGPVSFVVSRLGGKAAPPLAMLETHCKKHDKMFIHADPSEFSQRLQTKTIEIETAYTPENRQALQAQWIEFLNTNGYNDTISMFQQ